MILNTIEKKGRGGKPRPSHNREDYTLRYKATSGPECLGLDNRDLATARCAPASVTFHASAVAQQGEVAAFTTGISLIALHAGFSDAVEALIYFIANFRTDGDRNRRAITDRRHGNATAAFAAAKAFAVILSTREYEEITASDIAMRGDAMGRE